MKRNYNKLLTMSFIYSFVLVSFFFNMQHMNDSRIISYLLLIILSLILISYFVYQKNIELFDPMTLFTIYYFTIIPSGYFFVINNFEIGEYITSYNKDVYFLFNVAMIYIIVGYLSSVFGYYLVKQRRAIILRYESISQISNSILFWFAVINLFAGILNFVVNVMMISAGDIGAYMSTMSIRHALDLEIPHTTIFYINTYMSVYMFIFYLKRNQFNKGLILIPFFIAVILLFSTGRIFSTISYMLSVIAVYYYLDADHKKYTKRYVSCLFIILFSSLFIYVYRIASNFSLNYNDAPSSLNYLITLNILDFFQTKFLEKGNIPNIPVLMKIIDSWGDQIGFLYGQSLVSWVVNILPSAIRPMGYQPSVMIAKIGWFSDAGGAHPPTGIGEMYANFSILGPFVGMFMFWVLCAWMRNFVSRHNNFWVLIVYCQVTTSFIFLYSKGEFDNLSLWQVLPTVVSYFMLRFATQMFHAQKQYKNKMVRGDLS